MPATRSCTHVSKLTSSPPPPLLTSSSLARLTLFRTEQYMERTYLKRKQIDDVMGGADSWKNVDSTAGASLSLHCRPLSRSLTRSPLSPVRSRLPERVRLGPGLLHADPDPLGRRAEHDLLQVRRSLPSFSSFSSTTS